MNDEIGKLIEDMLNITEHDKYEFQKCCGFTFVFKRTIFEFNGQITSYEISPVGIIYEENDEIYFAPLDEVSKIEPIVKEFVDDCLK